MRQFRVGVLGAGSIGRRMLNAFSVHKQFEPALLWDPSPSALQAAVQQFPSLPVAADSRAIFGDESIDLVYLACPPQTHREHALSAVAANKPILCEKPLGVNLADSQALVLQIEQSGLPAAVNLLHASARGASEDSKNKSPFPLYSEVLAGGATRR
jgi:predicted dehydrogenase